MANSNLIQNFSTRHPYGVRDLRQTGPDSLTAQVGRTPVSVKVEGDGSYQMKVEGQTYQVRADAFTQNISGPDGQTYAMLQVDNGKKPLTVGTEDAAPTAEAPWEFVDPDSQSGESLAGTGEIPANVMRAGAVASVLRDLADAGVDWR